MTQDNTEPSAISAEQILEEAQNSLHGLPSKEMAALQAMSTIWPSKFRRFLDYSVMHLPP